MLMLIAVGILLAVAEFFVISLLVGKGTIVGFHATFTYRFSTMGVCSYYCMIHPFICGNVTVVGSTNVISVDISNFAFHPADLTVSVGTAVNGRTMIR